MEREREKKGFRSRLLLQCCLCMYVTLLLDVFSLSGSEMVSFITLFLNLTDEELPLLDLGPSRTEPATVLGRYGVTHTNFFTRNLIFLTPKLTLDYAHCCRRPLGL